ncbi:hypothetical protein GCM10009665_45410 [Kitasatospora nipponensis]|uniref:Uncharacterized protein n=1 Tax=Kitasatospora nipponensis TaxID=258049 RepID=A0ABN1WGJ3_9ACTN
MPVLFLLLALALPQQADHGGISHAALKGEDGRGRHAPGPSACRCPEPRRAQGRWADEGALCDIPEMVGTWRSGGILPAHHVPL